MGDSSTLSESAVRSRSMPRGANTMNRFGDSGSSAYVSRATAPVTESAQDTRKANGWTVATGGTTPEAAVVQPSAPAYSAPTSMSMDRNGKAYTSLMDMELGAPESDTSWTPAKYSSDPYMQASIGEPSPHEAPIPPAPIAEEIKKEYASQGYGKPLRPEEAPNLTAFDPAKTRKAYTPAESLGMLLTGAQDNATPEQKAKQAEATKARVLQAKRNWVAENYPNFSKMDPDEFYKNYYKAKGVKPLGWLDNFRATNLFER